MSVRSIPRNYRYVTGRVSTPKAAEGPEWEGGLERDHFTLLEMDPTVADFEGQPFQVFWTDSNGRRRRYTVDCRIRYKNGRSLIVEVKPRAFLRAHWKEFRPAYRLAVHQAALEGARFAFRTEREICIPFLETARFLAPIVRQGADEASQAVVLNKLSEFSETTPKDLMGVLADDEINQAYWLRVIWFLVGTYRIETDLNARLSIEMTIRSV